MENDLNRLWEEILAKASDSLPAGTAGLWLKTCIPTEMTDGTLTVDVPNVFVKEQISSRFQRPRRNPERIWQGRDIELQVGTETRKGEQKRAQEGGFFHPHRVQGGLNPGYAFNRL